MAGMERFTQRARRVLSLAHQEAERARHNVIGTEHLLLGLMDEEGGVAGRVLRELGLSTDRVREVVARVTATSENFDPSRVELGSETQQVLEHAVNEARRLGHHYIGTEHILLGLVLVDGMAMEVLRRLGITAEQIRRQTRRVLNETPAPASNIPSHMNVRAKTLSEVFLIYGHDLDAKHTVASYVESLGLQVIPLNENSFVSIDILATEATFVIILLTPDDMVLSESNPQLTRFRAGQNIIYEFGFFHGKLGSKRVCALFKGNGETELELSSESLRGACVRLDSAGEWKGWLARQMREAGLIIKSENIR
ncbi:MAG TPA: Clp protease N-terminal domain-containing protein [Anaerolineales bacterium]|nr:Clp protease N-terminal domain-containing protein [Anaerolineales bacterium]